MTVPISNTQTPANSSSGHSLFSIDATTDMVAWRIYAETNDPVVDFEFYLNLKNGSPGDLKFVITADADGIPTVGGGTPTDVGSTLVTKTAASLTAGAVNVVAFTSSYAPTAGTYYWIVAYAPAGVDGANNYSIREYFFYSGQGEGDERTANSTNTGSAWTGSRYMPAISPRTTAGAYLKTHSACAAVTASTQAAHNGSTPNERGTALTLPAGYGCTLFGAFVQFSLSASTADFELRAYLETTLQGSARSVDVSALRAGGTGAQFDMIRFPTPITITTAGIVRVGVKSTHASATVTIPYMDFGTTARKAAARAWADWWGWTMKDGGSLSELTNTNLYQIWPVMEIYSLGGGGGARGSLNRGLIQN